LDRAHGDYAKALEAYHGPQADPGTHVTGEEHARRILAHARAQRPPDQAASVDRMHQYHREQMAAIERTQAQQPAPQEHDVRVHVETSSEFLDVMAMPMPSHQPYGWPRP